MVGHSVLATIIKEFSYVSDINGITFEAAKGQNFAKYRIGENYTIDEENTNSILNIYSDKNKFSGIDEDFKDNNQLFNKFFNPNVYDEVCMSTLICGETKKYIPYCKQVLNEKHVNSAEKFKEIIDAFNDAYN